MVLYADQNKINGEESAMNDRRNGNKQTREENTKEGQ